MIDNDLIRQILRKKEERRWTLYDLSKKFDIQVTTIERWLKTGRINKIYASLIKEKLKLI